MKANETTEPVDRDELRRKLRERIHNRRNGCGEKPGPQLAQRLKDDPQTAMLQMGIDDPTILGRAKNIVDNPHTFLREMAQKEKKKKSKNKKPPLPPPASANEEEDLSEEEAPPPAECCAGTSS